MYRVGRPGQTMCINEGLATSRRYPGLCGKLYQSISIKVSFICCGQRLGKSITWIKWLGLLLYLIGRTTARFRSWLPWTDMCISSSHTDRSKATSISFSFGQTSSTTFSSVYINSTSSGTYSGSSATTTFTSSSSQCSFTTNGRHDFTWSTITVRWTCKITRRAI